MNRIFFFFYQHKKSTCAQKSAGKVDQSGISKVIFRNNLSPGSNLLLPLTMKYFIDLQRYSQSHRTACRRTEWPRDIVPASGSHWQPMDTFLFYRNYTRQTSGTAVNREAASFVNSAVIVLFTKPLSSVLGVVGMTSDCSSHWPHTWVKRFSEIVPGKVMEWPGTVRPVALWIASLVRNTPPQNTWSGKEKNRTAFDTVVQSIRNGYQAKTSGQNAFSK